MNRDYKTLYQKYKLKYLKLKESLNKDLVQNGGASDIEVILFRADWCPHCVAFNNGWKNLQADNELKELNTSFVTVNDDNQELKNHYEKFEVKPQGFPTLFAKRNGEFLEYMGPMDQNEITNFIKQI